MWNEKNFMDIAEQVVQWRRKIHSQPEVSTQEKQTSILVKQLLEEMNIPTRTFSDHYGVCGKIQGKYPGPVIAFRADMDALPASEATGLPFESKIPGVMHACGHDGHIAILLGLAKIFSLCRDELSGTIKFIFQPAEEAAPIGGAGHILKSGVLSDVDAIFGLHLWPDLPCGHIGIRKGALMAASDRLTIKLLGKGAHAGQPQYGVDAITIASDVMQGLGHIMSRQLDPMETATISIGTIKGGKRYNVIADEVELAGTVRTLAEEVRKEIPVKVERLLAGMAAAQGGEYRLDYHFGYPVLNNWDEPTEIVINAAQKVIGCEAVHSDIKPALTAEDFGRYLVKIPGAFFWLGCAKSDTGGRLHSSTFDMNEDALSVGMKIMYQTALMALKYYSQKKTA